MPMNIAELEVYTEFFLKPTHTLCLSSNHGMGKSTIVKRNLRRAIARKVGCQASEVMVIDKRGSQMEPSDVMGTQWMVGGQTYNAPPSWVPVHEDDSKWLSERLKAAGREWVPFNTAKVGIIFLDEFIRAPKMVQQALFEVLNDHSIHGLKMPDQWFVMCAINGDLDKYDGTRMDPALMDRVILIEFAPTKEEILDYLDGQAEDGLIHSIVPLYLRLFPDHLDPDDVLIEENTAEGKKGHSRRSWERLGEALQEGASKGKDLVEEVSSGKMERGFMQKVSAGYVGQGMATHFTGFVADDYGTLSPDEILNKFSNATEAKLKALAGRNAVALGGFNDSLVKELSKLPVKLPKKVSANLLRYLQAVPREVCSGFWKQWQVDKAAQASAWNVTPKRQALLYKAIASEVGYNNWLAMELKKNPNFSIDSDEPIAVGA